MTQEEKQLLLKDICARLQSSLICRVTHKDSEGWKEDDMMLRSIEGDEGFFTTENGSAYSCDFKPYLRSMSSMTKKEVEDFERTTKVFKYYPGHSMYSYIPVFDNDCTPFSTFDDDKEYSHVKPENVISCIDWLNSHHFDYRGLIKLGLAIEAHRNMYKI